ncbi:MAG TPA: DinB family protein [Caldilineae bacterium]|nr:DinB family protein [Caldilineae bacterium]
MSRDQLDALLAEIRALRDQTLSELTSMTEEEFAYRTEMPRWDDVRRVLLRFGDHMREHATQVAGTRDAIGRGPTMPQRILAEAEVAWGRMLAAIVGLTDEDLDKAPPDGGWSIRQVLEHVRDTEKAYLDAIRRAREAQGKAS